MNIIPNKLFLSPKIPSLQLKSLDDFCLARISPHSHRSNLTLKSVESYKITFNSQSTFVFKRLFFFFLCALFQRVGFILKTDRECESVVFWCSQETDALQGELRGKRKLFFFSISSTPCGDFEKKFLSFSFNNSLLWFFF